MVYSKLLYMQYLPQKAFWGPLFYTCTCDDIVKSVCRMCLRVLKRSQSEDSLIFEEITQNDKINVTWGKHFEDSNTTPHKGGRSSQFWCAVTFESSKSMQYKRTQTCTHIRTGIRPGARAGVRAGGRAYGRTYLRELHKGVISFVNYFWS